MPAPDDARIRNAVRLPALGLLVFAGLELIGSVGWVLWAVIWMASERTINEDEGAGMIALASTGLLTAAAAGLVALGAVRLLSMRGRKLGYAAGLVAMLPCTPFCILGVPLGAWTVYTLSRPDVRGALAGTAST